jgi:NAD(P)-dependent dehydrogenase (short-subunit alcohol dehydrogenase family)
MSTSIDIMDVSLGLDGTHILITGAAGQIGQSIVRAFLSAGAHVTAIDINESRMTLQHEKLIWLTADITDEESMQQAFDDAVRARGVVSTCVAAAGLDLSFIPHHESICDLPLDQWQRTISVNTTGTFLTARTWLRGIRDLWQSAGRNVSLIIIGSEAGSFGVPGNADYATSKAAIQYGLVKSMAPEAVRILSRARVNAVAPGPVDTPQFRKECAETEGVQYTEAEATVALRRSVPVEAVARACLMLASENYSGNITGQVIPVDSGKSGRLLWQQDGQPGW